MKFCLDKYLYYKYKFNLQKAEINHLSVFKELFDRLLKNQLYKQYQVLLKNKNTTAQRKVS